MADYNYSYWTLALGLTGGMRSLTRDEVKALGVTEVDVGLGFFKKRMSRGGPFAPVAIWLDGAELVCVIDGKPASALDVWTYCCPHVVSEEMYRERMDSGKWTDECEAVTASLAPQKIGSNMPPTDPAEILRGKIDAAKAGIDAFAKIETDEAAGQAQSLRSRLLELSGDADKKREELKKPHLEAGRLVDSTYQPLVKDAKAGADTLRAAIGAYETEKERARQEAERKRVRMEQEVERVRLAAIETGKPAPPVAAPAPPPEPVPAPTTRISGSYGRAANVRTVKVCTVTKIEDAMLFFKTHADMVALVAKLAQQATNNGFSVPGTTVEERKDVR